MSFGIVASSYAPNSVGSGGTSQYTTEVLADAPLLYWRLGESGGTVAVDSSGNGRNGTYVGTTIFGVRSLVEGDTDTAVYFTLANTNYVVLSQSPWMDVTDMTISCVVGATLSGIQMLASRYHDPNGDRSWFLYTQNGYPKFYARDSGGGETIVDSGFQCIIGRRYYVVGYASGAEVGIRVYDATGLVGSATGVGRAVNSSTRPFMVGRSDDGASYQAEAYIDEVAFYGSVLPTARLDVLAAEAMVPKYQWINRASGVSPRNGTTNHTIAFPATSANSFMVAIVNTVAEQTMVSAGWTKRIASYSNTELAVFTRTANAGETSLQLTTNFSNVAVNYAVYEFPSGTWYHSGVQDPDGPWPTLAGLPGTPTTVFAAIGAIRTDPLDPPQSGEWYFGWKEDLDIETPDDGTTNGQYTGIGYKDLYLGTSAAVTFGTDFTLAVGGPDRQHVLFALITP